MSTINFSHH